MATKRRLYLLVAATVFLVTMVMAQTVAPFSRADIYQLKVNGVAEHRILALVAEQGINFEPTDENLQALKQAGATSILLDGLRSARLKEHTDTARKLDAAGDHADAEKEWRLALALAPADGGLHLGLGASLFASRRYDEAIQELNIAAATEPGAEERLQAAREQADQQRRETELRKREAEQHDREAERLHAQEREEDARRLAVHRTTGLAGQWMDSRNNSLIYTVTVNGSAWQAHWEYPGSGLIDFNGNLAGRTITGTRVRRFRDRSCLKDIVLQGNMAAAISDNGDSIVINYQNPNFKSTGLFGCGIKITGYTPQTITLIRLK